MFLAAAFFHQGKELILPVKQLEMFNCLKEVLQWWIEGWS